MLGRMRLRPLLVLILLFLATPAAGPVSAEEPPTATVPTGLPVQLDGALAPSEWADALRLELGSGQATLRIKQFRGTLLLAYETADAWIEGEELLLSFAPHGAAKDMGAWTDGALSLRYEPIQHDRNHLLVNRMDGTAVVPTPHQIAARVTLARRSSRAELAIPLTLLGVDRAHPRPLRMSAVRTRPGGVGETPTWPRGLDVGARPGRMPADMRSSARWGVLDGLKDAGAPGAYSKDDWNALISLQSEIHRRGSEAHVLMREMEEEHTSFKKQESLVDEQIFGNLAWIAEREPLGDVDRLLMAKAHRFMNRNEEALALLDAMIGSPNPNTARRALYEKTFALRNLGRFAEEATVWNRLAERTQARNQKRAYANRASVARRQEQELVPVRAAVAADAARTDLPLVELTTDRGVILIRLLRHDTPKAAAHFEKLVADGFYDGLHWHRVLLEFMAQCGDPGSKDGDCAMAGSGDSDTKVDVEQNERLRPGRGAVCFARKRGLYSNGSQFFITTTPQLDLVDGDKVPYTLFGWVASGMDVVDRLDYCDKLVRARVLYSPAPPAAPPAAADPAKDGDSETESGK